MPKIDLAAIPVKTGSAYPGAMARMMDGRSQTPLSDAGNLTQFGANLVTLAPGAMSALRHWHEKQDELVYVTRGVCTLIDDHGETTLNVGDCAAFPAGDANGHHIVNRSESEAQFLVVGTNTETEVGHYSDEDMIVVVDADGFHFMRRDGTPVVQGD